MNTDMPITIPGYSGGSKLTEGGMGSIYYCTNDNISKLDSRSIGSGVIVKIPKNPNNLEFKNLFKNEARLLAEFNGQGSFPYLIDCNLKTDIPYIIIAHYEGSDFADIL